MRAWNNNGKRESFPEQITDMHDMREKICDSMNEKDFEQIAKKSEKLIKWLVEQDISVNDALFMLCTTLVSFAKQYDVPKSVLDKMHEDMWKAVKTYDKA